MTIDKTTAAMLFELSNLVDTTTAHRALVLNYLRPTDRDDAQRAVLAWIEAGCPDADDISPDPTRTYRLVWGSAGMVWGGEVTAESESAARQAWIDADIDGVVELRPMTDAEVADCWQPGSNATHGRHADHLFHVAEVVPA